MLVTRILSELDAQLQRLQTARDTIASLTAPLPAKRERISRKSIPQPADVGEPAITQAPPATAALPATTTQMLAEAAGVPARRRGRPKGSVNRRPAAPRARVPQRAEPTALARVVATGPVFVSAAELERRRAQTLVMAAPKPLEHRAAEGSLDALIREVAERRTATAA